MWGAGMVTAQATPTSSPVRGCSSGGVWAVSPAWGSLTGRKDSNKTLAGWWTWRDGGLWHREWDVYVLGFFTLPGGG